MREYNMREILYIYNCMDEESARERRAVVARAESTHEITDKRGTDEEAARARAARAT